VLLLATIVDACLRDGRGGSPTAVLRETELSDAERRLVPRLTGTSHAVFVSADGEEAGQAQASLRFFTVTGELPGCGHGTVAALAFLVRSSECREYRGTLVAGTRSFAGRATLEGDQARASFDPGDVKLRAPTGSERDLALKALGHHPGILASDICVGLIGRPRLLVAISTDSALAGLKPDHECLRNGCDRLGLLGCYAYSPPTAGGRVAARMFAPSIGVLEDIANANSTACLAAAMAQLGIAQISVDMGDSLSRPATITATTQQTPSGVEIRVGGAARVVGTLRLDSRDLAPVA
jgi:trans-2,3-dihydro-3-hydroxyanthranilate isomerase